MAETKDLLVTLEDLKAKHDYDQRKLGEKANNVDLKAGTIETAEYHLGFYLDENGDLCQKED